MSERHETDQPGWPYTEGPPMSERVNAADVLGDIGDSDDFVAALLAHGEQGVAILPDGTLRALEFHGNDYGPGEEDVELFRLVPLSAEAGDTDD
jgi:hypothetical protein